MDPYAPQTQHQQPTLVDEVTLLSPPTPGEKTVIQFGMGLTLAFMLWMLVGAPGIGD
jgi:hypothetical protein